MLRNCLYCGEEFEPAKPKQKFCCDKHRVYYNRGKVHIHPLTEDEVEQKKEPAAKEIQPPPGLTGIDLAIWKAEQKQK